MSSYNLPKDAPVDERFTAFLQSVKPLNLYSQHGEDGILAAIFERIGTANKWCFECGAADGLFFSNTRRLVEQDWFAVLVECDGSDFTKLRERYADAPRVCLMQAFLVADKRDNLTEITLDGVLARFRAPEEIDLVVLDIDSQEYYIVNSLTAHRPRVLVVEYDPLAEPMFIPELRGKGQAGLMAMRYVCESRGYQVIGRTATNLICVRNDLAPMLMEKADILEPPIQEPPIVGMRRLGHEVADDAQWERETHEFLKDAKGVIHVGASYGEEREFYAAHKLPVAWIEAIPEVYRELEKNTARYLPKQQAHCFLITDKDKEKYNFGISNNGGQSSSIFPLAAHREIWPTVEYVETRKLKSITLDTFVEWYLDRSQYDTLVLDVQGAELLVLKGAEKSLPQFNWIRAEASDFDYYEGACQLKDLDEYLLPRGFDRVQTWRGVGKPGMGHYYECLYKRREAKAEPSKGRVQVFADGRWQDADVPGAAIAVTQEEMELAQKGLLPTRTLVSDGPRKINIALCLSVPRLGFLDAFYELMSVVQRAGLSVNIGFGVFWHHSLSRSIKNALECTEIHHDFILTADYDTFTTPEDLLALAKLLAEHPEADCIVPLQAKRGIESEILATFDKANLYHDLIPITSGHFGFTLFRREFFERMPKPWFWEKADADGDWGGEDKGRIDADMGFWRNAAEAGLKTCLAPHIVIGHGEEMVSYPVIEGGKVRKTYQTVNDWLRSRTKPEGIGVR